MAASLPSSQIKNYMRILCYLTRTVVECNVFDVRKEIVIGCNGFTEHIWGEYSGTCYLGGHWSVLELSYR